jgi:quinol monooxygenase YgiN
MPTDIRVVAILKFKAGKKDAVAAAIRGCLQPSRAEPGCLFYVPHWDKADDQRVVFIEHWRSQDDLDKHMKTTHFNALIERLDGLLDGVPDIRTLTEFE